MASATTGAGVLNVIPGVSQSHRGHGFALGSTDFHIGHWPNNRSADVAMGGPSGRHGSGAHPRLDRERDRPRERSMGRERASSAGNARAQATQNRMSPVGKQEEADWSNALENVLTRNMAIGC